MDYWDGGNQGLDNGLGRRLDAGIRKQVAVVSKYMSKFMPLHSFCNSIHDRVLELT